MNLLKKTLSLLCFFALCCTCTAQITFSRFIIDSALSSPGLVDDADFHMHRTLDNGYIISGTNMYGSVDPWLIKTDSIGNIQWTKSYSGALQNTGVVQAGASSYIVAAFQSGSGSYQLFKVTNNGSTVVWQRKYTLGSTIPRAGGMILTKDSSVVIAASTSPNSSVMVLKLTLNGTLVWARKINTLGYNGGTSHEYPIIRQTTDGGYILTGGNYFNYSSNMGVFPVLVKLDSLGNLQWTKQYTDSAYVPTCIAQTPDKGYIAVAQDFTNLIGPYQPPWGVHVFKTDSLGNLQWYKKTTRPAGYSAADTRALCIANAGGGYVMGTMVSTATDENGPDILTLLDNNGDTVWNRSLGDTNSDNELGTMEQTPDGGFIVARMHGFITLNPCCTTASYGVAYTKTDLNGKTCTNYPHIGLFTSALSITQLPYAITDSLKAPAYGPLGITPQFISAYEDTICYRVNAINSTATAKSAQCYGQCNGMGIAHPTGGTLPYTYSWTPSGGTADTATGLCAGNYTVTITDAIGNTSASLVIITQPPTLTAGYSATDAHCNADSNGYITILAGGGTTPYTYSWSNGQTTSAISGLSAGTYICSIHDTNGCMVNDTITIGQPAVIKDSVSSVNAACGKNGSATVTASGGTGALSYNWAPAGGTGATASNLSAGTYTVTITDIRGCTSTATALVNGSNAPMDSACCSATISPGQTVVLSVVPGSAGNHYQWYPSSSLSCDTCLNPVASPTVTTWYHVTVTDSEGCTKTDSVLITVKETCGSVYVPNAFSPNADGYNDVLYVYGNCIQTMQFRIYDRWGNKVFESSDPKIGWNGTFQGQPMNTGTYVYTLTVIDFNNNTTTKKGNITLIR